jgi:hypothetical protein
MAAVVEGGYNPAVTVVGHNVERIADTVLEVECYMVAVHIVVVRIAVVAHTVAGLGSHGLVGDQPY